MKGPNPDETLNATGSLEIQKIGTDPSTIAPAHAEERDPRMARWACA